MRSFRERQAERAAWREYRGALAEMDRALHRMEAEGISTGSAEYTAAWTDRMGYAANRYPGAPAPDLSDLEPEAEIEP